MTSKLLPIPIIGVLICTGFVAAQDATPQKQLLTFSGTITDLRGRAIPGGHEGIVPFYVKDGEDIRRFVARFVATAGEPATVVELNGKRVAADDVEGELNAPGVRVKVVYHPEQYRETEAHLATRVEIAMGNAPEARADGLVIEDLEVGTGPAAQSGQLVTVHYTGWLTNGTRFDASHDHGKPFQFRLGARMVIRGWDIGVEGMRVGGKRKLTIPPGLAYGAKGAGGVIPPNATLIFEVELLRVQ